MFACGNAQIGEHIEVHKRPPGILPKRQGAIVCNGAVAGDFQIRNFTLGATGKPRVDDVCFKLSRGSIRNVEQLGSELHSKACLFGVLTVKLHLPLTWSGAAGRKRHPH